MSETSTVCPFCPLACDDVRVRRAAAGRPQTTRVVGVEVDCDLAQQRYRDALQTLAPRIGTETVSLTAIQRHLAQLRASRPPIEVVTRGTDLVTARVLEHLDSSRQLTWLLEQSPLARAWQRTSSRDGIIGATFGDARLHGDLFWMIGDVTRSMPRVHQRILDAAPSGAVIDWPGPLDPDALAQLVMATRAQAASTDSSHSVAHSIARLSAAIDRSRYFVVLLGEDAFSASVADATTSLLVRWIWGLNEKRRAVVLFADHAATDRAVYRWRNNRSLASWPSAGPPAAGRLSVRLGAASTSDPPVDVLIGANDPGVDGATVYVPAATVGVHHAGIIVRGDGTVTLPLEAIASSDWPTQAQWLEQWLVPESLPVA